MVLEPSTLQTVTNGLITGSIYFLAAVGLTLQYQLMKFPNLSHAELFAVGAFVTYLLADVVKLGFWPGLAFSMLFTGGVAAALYITVFKTLIKRGATLLHLIIASAGLGILLRYLMWEIAGRKSYFYSHVFSPFDVGPVRLTTLWLAMIVVAVASLIALLLFLSRTRVGKALRGLASNPVLARLSGVRSEAVIVLVWAVSGMLAALGGTLRAADTRIIPELGVEVLIPMFAVSILGGIGSVSGAFAAAYIIGLSESFGVVALSRMGLSTEYKALIAFAALVATIIVLPTGLSSLISKERMRRD
ncbi:High-affinity branched-chain amino acid transport system permease protein LivH [archaeon HR01]|nr:High-affinity branched-chain amino acid transport system permease protein LivH [archaeon HR01]